MTDFRIRHCDLEIVRRAGEGGLWSSLADRRDLAKRAQVLFLGSIEELLSTLLPEEGDIHLSDPVEVTIPLRIGDLQGGAAGLRSSAFRAAKTAFARALPHAIEMERSYQPPPSAESGDAEALDLPPVGDQTAGLLDMLLAWHREGSLALRLSLFGAEALMDWEKVAWESVVARNAGGSTSRAPPSAGEIQEVLSAVATMPRAQQNDQNGLLEARLTTLVRLLAEFGTAFGGQEVRDLVERHFPLPLDPATGSGEAEPFGLPPVGGRPAGPLDLLLAWHREGSLATHLSLFSAEALMDWETAVCEWSGTRKRADTLTQKATQPPPSAAELQEIVRSVAQEYEGPPTNLKELLQVRLMTLVRLVADFGTLPDEQTVRDLLDGHFPLPRKARPGKGDGRAKVNGFSPVKSAVAPPYGDDTVPIPSPAAPPSGGPASVDPGPLLASEQEADDRLGQGTFAVESAVPFLLLSSLHKIGYLEALAGVLTASSLTAFAPHFACALAYKVLGPPERGWRRTPQTRHAAAVFSGLTAPPPEQEIVEFARRSKSRLTPLDAAVTAALARGHQPSSPYLLAKAGERLLLVDTDGLFPLLFAESWSQVADKLDLCGQLILLGRDIATPTLLGALNESGVTFFADGPPGRGEAWFRTLGPNRQQWMTNAAAPLRRQHAPFARRLQPAAEQTAVLIQGLIQDRPSAPLARVPDLEESTTLAAALALGDIAWTLSKLDEANWATPDPMLALARFETLSARVRFSREKIEVMLPLGRRHRDLRANGLIDTVPIVPWLDGRAVEFSGG